MNSKETQRSGKVVVVGDGACGKTCLLEVFKKNKFPETYIPTVVDNFVKEVQLKDGKCVSLALWDTAGQEDYDTIRPLSYRDTDLLFLCYTIESRDGIQEIQRKWLPEITNHCPTSKFLLIGLKKDMRDPSDPKFDKSSWVTECEGEKVAEEINAAGFFECSALTGENVTTIFEKAARLIWDMKDGTSRPKKHSEFSSCFWCC